MVDTRAYSDAFESGPISMALLDRNGTIVAVNSEWRRFAQENDGQSDGYIGYNYLEECAPHDDSVAREMVEAIRSILAGNRDEAAIEYPCHAPDQERWFLLRAWAFGDFTDRGCAVMHIDITRRYIAEREARAAADRDPLTGLLNRRSFAERAEQALARVRRMGTNGAVLFVDLDDFKPVNDEGGHAIGDEVLQVVGERLANELRETDALARVGGDEFALVLEVPDKENAKFVARRVQSILGQALAVRGTTYHLACSVGIALHPVHGQTVAALLEVADGAMYRARREKECRVKVADMDISSE